MRKWTIKTFAKSNPACINVERMKKLWGMLYCKRIHKIVEINLNGKLVTKLNKNTKEEKKVVKGQMIALLVKLYNMHEKS